MLSKENETARTGGVDAVDARIARLARVGTGVLRYGVVFLLVVIGAAKYFAFEAEGIKPLVEHSPLLSWMITAFGVQGASNVIGTIEIAIGLAIASRPLAPALSAMGSGLGVVSFLFTTPGALSPQNPANGFLMKDIVLLGACIATAAEALKAARVRKARPVATPFSSVPATRSA